MNSKLIVMLTVLVGVLVAATVISKALLWFKKSDGNKEIWTRTMSWWKMLAVFSLCTLAGDIWTITSLSILSFLILRELLNMASFENTDRGIVLFFYTAAVIAPFSAYFFPFHAYLTYLSPIVAVCIQMVLQGNVMNALARMSKLAFVYFIAITVPVHVALLFGEGVDAAMGAESRLMLVCLFLIVELNDVMQFVFGKLFGKHKLIPKVSPNKTVEGALLGMFAAGAFGFFAFRYSGVNLEVSLIISAVLPIVGTFGDLFISLLKRDVKVKDTGTLIAGHGGILDRMDSMLFASAVFYNLLILV